MKPESSRTVLPGKLLARGLIVAGALFLSYAFFYQAGGWNQNSRYDLVRAIVKEHTLRIDDFHANTGDKALIDGHYYSDKAPGVSFLAVPAVAAARPVFGAVGIDKDSEGALTTLSYLATLVGVAVPTALAGLGIFLLALRLGASSGGATFAAMSFGIATPIWAYATLFWGHAATAAFLLGGFAAAVLLREAGSARRDYILGAIVGLSAGWATVTEFTAAVPAVLIATLAIKHTSNREADRRARTLVALGGGALACGLVLMVHNALAFGSPFEFGYSHSVNWPQMRQGLFGVGVPDGEALWGVSFGLYRGLVPLAPVVVAAPVGFYLLAKTRDRRASVLVAGAIALYYVIIAAGYWKWQGGWTYGPRHMAPALPFLCLALAAVWTRARLVGHVILFALCLWGAALSLVAVSTVAQPPEYEKRPLTELLWPSFRDGRLSRFTVSIDALVDDPNHPPILAEDEDDRAAWNVGEQLGLSGHVSLVPLLALWSAAAVAWWRVGRRSPNRSAALATAPVTDEDTVIDNMSRRTEPRTTRRGARAPAPPGPPQLRHRVRRYGT